MEDYRILAVEGVVRDLDDLEIIGGFDKYKVGSGGARMRMRDDLIDCAIDFGSSGEIKLRKPGGERRY